MKKRWIEVFLICGLIAASWSVSFAADLVLENRTVAAGQVVDEYAPDNILARYYTIQGGANVSFNASHGIKLGPGFKVQDGAKFRTRLFGTDTAPPVILSAYPTNGGLVGTAGTSQLHILITFGDAGAGVGSVVLRDANGQDITAQASLTTNTIDYTISNPVNGQYNFSLILEDHLHNATTVPISFVVDTIAPVTTPSITGGNFPDSKLTVDLSCSETATIYYSTDGYPPFVGAANTIKAPAPAHVTINGAVKCDLPKYYHTFCRISGRRI